MHELLSVGIGLPGLSRRASSLSVLRLLFGRLKLTALIVCNVATASCGADLAMRLMHIILLMSSSAVVDRVLLITVLVV